MNQDQIVVIDNNNEKLTLSRFEYYARLMKSLEKQEEKGGK